MNFGGDRTPYIRTHCVTKIRYLEQLSAGNSTEHDFLHFHPGGGILQEILGWGVPRRSSNPDPVSDQKMKFSTLVFRLDL